MNYQTFSNLQFILLLKISFHSFHITLRNTSGEKKPFVPVGTTRFILMFGKASNILSWRDRRFTVVASRQVEFPF